VSKVFKTDDSTYVAALRHEDYDPEDTVVKGRSWRADPNGRFECDREFALTKRFGTQISFVRLLDSTSTEDTNWMLFERAWGDMWSWVVEKHFFYSALGRDDRRLLVEDILDGVYRLHEQGVLHGDLKMDNIFVYNIGGRWRAKLGDLGIACVLAPSPSEPQWQPYECGHIVYASAMRPPEVSAAFRSYGNTAHSITPSAFRREIDLKADMWALGITLYFIMYRRFPWPREGDHAWPTAVREDDALKYHFIDRYVADMWSSSEREEWERQLLRCLLTLSPARRCNASGALDAIHNFFHVAGQV